jgi:hypothetical protein
MLTHWLLRIPLPGNRRPPRTGVNGIEPGTLDCTLGGRTSSHTFSQRKDQILTMILSHLKMMYRAIDFAGQ